MEDDLLVNSAVTFLISVLLMLLVPHVMLIASDKTSRPVNPDWVLTFPGLKIQTNIFSIIKKMNCLETAGFVNWLCERRLGALQMFA